jgi:hypothetical protein
MAKIEDRAVQVTAGGINKTLKAALEDGDLAPSVVDAVIDLTGNAETITIPLTQAGLVQEEDYQMIASGAAGMGSTATTVVRFSSASVSGGSCITYEDSAANGATFTVVEDGTYTIDYYLRADYSTSAHRAGIILNGAMVAEGYDKSSSAITGDRSVTVSVTRQLVAGDYFQFASLAGTTMDVYNIATITKLGKLKQVNVNPDHTVDLDTSYLRLEGISARGAVKTRVAKFDTVAITTGDAFTVTTSTDDGTYITVNKAGTVTASATAHNTTSAMGVTIAKNLTSYGAYPDPSQVMASATSDTSGSSAAPCAAFPVVAGDTIWLSLSANPTSPTLANFNLYFVAKEVAVSVTNTQPQFSESDSAIEVNTPNGFGSTSTSSRRFSTVATNVGTDITFTDNATYGSYFTVLTSGIYHIGAYDRSNSSTTSVIGYLSKHVTVDDAGTVLSYDGDGVDTASTINKYHNVKWSGYLTAGTIIKYQVSNTSSGVVGGMYIAKVGKPNVTGVDVTPFVRQALQTTQTASASGAGTYTGGIVSLTPTITSGSGIFSYSAGTFTALKTCRINISCSARNNAAATMLISATTSAGAGAMRSNSVAAAGNYASASDSAYLTAGQTFYFQVETGTADIFRYDVVAVAEADSILTETTTFSTDSASLTYAGSATYTLSTLANAPVGTFITYTYATSTNTRTQTTTAPTQTTADMNTNGIQIFTRAYNAASTAGSPACIAIQIGKGMKGVSLGLYKSAGKVTGCSKDVVLSSSDTVQYGVPDIIYEESTGILMVDAGRASSAAVTQAIFRASDATNSTSGYLTISASKNPALAGINTASQVSARYRSDAGQAIGTSVTLLNYEDKLRDTHNAYSAGVYTVPETGFYNISASFLTASFTPSAGNNSIVLYLYINDVSYHQVLDRTGGTVATSYSPGSLSVNVRLSKGDTVKMYGLCAVATTMNTATEYNYFSIVRIS